MKIEWIPIIIIGMCFINMSYASVGDRTQLYNNCRYTCQVDKCKNEKEFKEHPSLILRLTYWSCGEDCRYFCMWSTVEFFASRNLPVPQFHGKWPFVRILGLQEPASTIFSLLNLYTHAISYIKFKKLTGPTSPMFFTWTWLTVICLHGWFWSTVFHARDTVFTEMMDYTGAFSMVLTLYYCLLLRILCGVNLNAKVFIVISSIYGSILYTHLSYLSAGNIDYNYNMIFNIIIGLLCCLTSIIWWYRNYRIITHVQILFNFTVLTVLVTFLEIADFPPILWIFDAHSLWHAATIPLVPLLYKFTTADCTYLKRLHMKTRSEYS